MLSCGTGAEASGSSKPGSSIWSRRRCACRTWTGWSWRGYVREHAPQAYIPIVIVSGDVNERLVNRELSEYVTDYFDKSLGFNALSGIHSRLRASAEPRPSGEVLYVEDSRVVALATRRMLEKYGLTVLHVNSVEDAVAVLETAMAQGRIPGARRRPDRRQPEGRADRRATCWSVSATSSATARVGCRCWS